MCSITIATKHLAIILIISFQSAQPLIVNSTRMGNDGLMKGIVSSVSEPWGNWTKCDKGKLLKGLYIDKQSDLNQIEPSNSEYKISEIKFICEMPGVEVTEHTNQEWKNNNLYTCGGFIVGFQLKINNVWRSKNDGIITNLKVFCSEGNSTVLSQSENDGTWTEKKTCKNNQAVCGMRTMIKNPLNRDDLIGINFAKWLECCDIEEEVCAPSDKWEVVFEIDNSLGLQPIQYTYTKKIGVTIESTKYNKNVKENLKENFGENITEPRKPSQSNKSPIKITTSTPVKIKHISSSIIKERINNRNFQHQKVPMLNKLIRPQLHKVPMPMKMNPIPMNPMSMNKNQMKIMPINTKPMKMNLVPMNSNPMNPTPINSNQINQAPINTNKVNPTKINQMPINQMSMNQINKNPNSMNTMKISANQMNPNPVNQMSINLNQKNQMPMNQNQMKIMPINTEPMNPIPMNSNQINQAPINTNKINPTLVNTNQMNPIPINTNNMNPTTINQMPMDQINKSPNSMNTMKISTNQMNPNQINQLPTTNNLNEKNQMPMILNQMNPIPIIQFPTNLNQVNQMPINQMQLEPMILTPIQLTPQVTQNLQVNPLLVYSQPMTMHYQTVPINPNPIQPMNVVEEPSLVPPDRPPTIPVPIRPMEKMGRMGKALVSISLNVKIDDNENKTEFTEANNEIPIEVSSSDLNQNKKLEQFVKDTLGKNIEQIINASQLNSTNRPSTSSQTETKTIVSNSTSEALNETEEMRKRVKIRDLATVFKKKIKSSTATGFNWEKASTDTWAPMKQTSIDITVEPGHLVKLYQVVGSCGNFKIRPEKFFQNGTFSESSSSTTEKGSVQEETSGFSKMGTILSSVSSMFQDVLNAARKITSTVNFPKPIAVSSDADTQSSTSPPAPPAKS